MLGLPIMYEGNDDDPDDCSGDDDEDDCSCDADDG